jgi:hypothetical protein
MLGSPGEGFRGPAKLGEVTQLQCITITNLAAHRERLSWQSAASDSSGAAVRDGQARCLAAGISGGAILLALPQWPWSALLRVGVLAPPCMGIHVNRGTPPKPRRYRRCDERFR